MGGGAGPQLRYLIYGRPLTTLSECFTIRKKNNDTLSSIGSQTRGLNLWRVAKVQNRITKYFQEFLLNKEFDQNVQVFLFSS